MAEWGVDPEYDRQQELQKQASHHKEQSRRTTLEKDYAYYLEQADDTTLPADQRTQWARLAEEVATRLGLNAPTSEQIELF